MSEGFIRQRRNLMLISMFLLIYDFANIEITKVSLLGTELLAGRPDVLELVVWLIWAYLLVRYAQYLVTDDSHPVLSEFSRMRRKLLEQEARSRFDIDAKCRIQPSFGRSVIGVSGWQAEIYELRSDHMGGRQETKKDTWNIGRLLAIKVTAVAAYQTSLHTTAVTDIVLPIALAVSVSMVAVFELICSW